MYRGAPPNVEKNIVIHSYFQLKKFGAERASEPNTADGRGTFRQNDNADALADSTALSRLMWATRACMWLATSTSARTCPW